MATGWSGQPEAVGILGALAEFTKIEEGDLISCPVCHIFSLGLNRDVNLRVALEE